MFGGMFGPMFGDVLIFAAKYLFISTVALSPVFLTTDRKKEFANIMINCGLINKEDKTPLAIKKTPKGNCIEYVLHIPAGLSKKDFETKKESLSQAFEGDIELQRADNYKLIMTVYKGKLGTMYPFELIQGLKPVEFAIGYTRKGLLTMCLDDAEPHCAIGGTSGSGKSVFLSSVITQAILKPSSQLKVSLIDMKNGVEFAVFEKSSRVEYYAKDKDTTIEVLTNLTNLMNQRLEKLAKCGVRNISEYNAKFKQKKMAYHLLCIDEFTLLKHIPNAHEMVEVLLCQARCVGIHIIISLQTHHAENLPATIKTNLSTVVAFKMKNRSHSQVLLEDGIAAELRGKGHGILSANGELNEFQGFYISDTQIREFIRETYIEKKPEEPEQIGVIKSANKKKRKAGS